jgi:hypothetical protein
MTLRILIISMIFILLKFSIYLDCSTLKEYFWTFKFSLSLFFSFGTRGAFLISYSIDMSGGDEFKRKDTRYRAD